MPPKSHTFTDIKFFRKISQNFIQIFGFFYCLSEKRENFLKLKVIKSQIWLSDRGLRRPDINNGKYVFFHESYVSAYVSCFSIYFNINFRLEYIQSKQSYK
jgi:hypothetical protein